MTGKFSSTGDTKTVFNLNNIIVTLPVSFSDERKSWACLNNRELNTTSTGARTSSENITSCFCNHFSIIQSFCLKNVF